MTFAGTLAVTSVAEAAGPNAEILLCQYEFNVKSATDATLTVKEKFRINNEKGAGIADFVLYTDTYRSLSSFSGNIENGGKTIKKIRLSDIIKVQSSNAFADDSYANLYSPDAPYPCVIEYNYTVSYRKAIATFPTFIPVTGEDVPLEKASYTITVPAGLKVNWKSSLEHPQTDSDAKTQSYKWEWKNFPGFKTESNMPSVMDLLPYVYACPASFSYDGYSGSQDNWEDVGKWLFGIFPQDSELPDNIKAKVHELTDDCPDELGKIRTLYSWLREHTRYVSIQFGIGGYSPMSPSTVAKNGYGDCKALSYLMKRMLAEAGIDSDYLIANTGRSNVIAGYSSIGQMNHAMLCIPIQKDTIWMECTNPSVPLGFRHSSIAGHQCVLVTDKGGKLVRCPNYPDSLRCDRVNIKVRIKTDDSLNGNKCEFNVRSTKLADAALPFEKLTEQKREDIVRHLSTNFCCGVDNLILDGVQENFASYGGEPGFIPRADINFRFTSSTFAKMNGERMIFPLSPYSMQLNYQKTARVHPFVHYRQSVWYMSTEYTIPDNFEVEFVPQSISAESDGAVYSLDTDVSEDGKTIYVRMVLKNKVCKIPATDYSAYRDFVKEYNKRIGASIILKKRQ